MSNYRTFLNTLKRIGLNDVESLEETDLQVLLCDKKLSSFVEVFCTLDESNILSSEEIQEYAELKAHQISELEEFEKSDLNFDKGCADEYRKIDFHSLQEKLKLVETHNQRYEQQIEQMKSYEENLFHQLETLSLQLVKAKKKLQFYELSIIPKAENEFVSSLMFLIKTIEELNLLISQSNSGESKLPASRSFEEAVKDYLKSEELILQCIQVFLDKNFLIEENSKVLSFTAAENSENSELFKETSFLKKVLQEQILKKISSEISLERLSASIKYFQSEEASLSMKCHHLQLIENLAVASNKNEKLKKSYEELTMFLSNAVAKYVDAEFTRIVTSIDNKTRNCLHHAINEILLPLNALLLQRARLEMLISSLMDHKKTDLESIKHDIESFAVKLQQEKAELEERIAHNAADAKEQKYPQCGLTPETSIFLSLFAILSMPQEVSSRDLSSVTLEDVLQRVNKLLEVSCDLERKFEERLKAMNKIENQAKSLEVILSGSSPDFANWHEAEHSLSTDLNKLSTKLSLLETNLAECSREFEHKEKSLQAKRNIAMARILYVNALTNPDCFKECMKSIEDAVKNTAEY